MPDTRTVDLLHRYAHRRAQKANDPLGFDVRAQGDDGEIDLFIYDVIGDDFFGITARQVGEQLSLHRDAKTINVRINSPGGNAADGLSIYNLLTQHPAHVIVHVDGVAWSAASIVAMAGDERRMAESAELMLHNAWTIAIGNADAMRTEAELLDQLDHNLAKVYSDRSHQEIDAIAAVMDAETFYTAEQAIEAGLADTLIPNKAGSDSNNHATLPRRAAAMPRDWRKLMTTLAKENPMSKKNDTTPAPQKDNAQAKGEPEKKDDVTPAASPDASSQASQQPAAAPQPEPQQQAQAKAGDDNRANASKPFIDAFGEDDGSRYFARGLSFEQALAEHAKAQNAVIKDLQARLAGTDRGQDNPVDADLGDDAQASGAKPKPKSRHDKLASLVRIRA